MNSILIKFLSPLAILLLPNLLYAGSGAISGGGGRSVVCRDELGHVQRAELLDLYEAQKIFGLTLTPELGSYELHIKQMISKLPQYVVYITEESIKKDFLKRIHFVDSSDQLEPVNDSFEPVAPKNCKIEQVANYHQSGRILISEEIWNALSPRNRAALTLHEIAYYQSRTNGAPKSSYYVRRFVGLIFSTQSVRPPEKITGYDVAFECLNSDMHALLNRTYQFKIYANKCPNAEGYYCDTKIQFTYLAGQNVLDRTQIKGGGDILGLLLNPERIPGNSSGMSPIQSDIFEGVGLLYTTIQVGSERRLKVALSGAGPKEFVDMICEQTQVMEPVPVDQNGKERVGK